MKVNKISEGELANNKIQRISLEELNKKNLPNIMTWPGADLIATNLANPIKAIEPTHQINTENLSQYF